tara:strand:- start:655 stop:3420 length:2766 start_codon:yes stop_codon:yes gene_type:complete
MDQNIREIEYISFGLYSAEEIKNMSVCNLDNPKKNGKNSVYDPRMGTTNSKIKCETCDQNAEICPGHFGRIELNVPILHPLYYKQIINFLKCFCFKCNKLLLTEEQLILQDLNKFKGNKKFKKILDKLEKINVCCQIKDDDKICGNNNPDIKFNINENTINMVYRENKNKTSILLTTEEIYKIFNNISNEDVEILGFDSKLVHPRNYIISVLPVLPPIDRPYVKADGNICDDDLTNQYVEIIKYNNYINNTDDYSKKTKFIQYLQFRILTLFNNGKGKAKHSSNKRPIKGIKERITGKEGQIRNNMMGKRVNQSGRTVIGPEPTLKLGELAVPRKMATILTIPERATIFNLHKLNKLINEGKANFIRKNKTNTHINLKRYINQRGTKLFFGDIIHRKDKKIIVTTGKEVLKIGDKIFRDNKFLDNVKIPFKREYKLNIGDVVERQLQNGDYVLLNRQPTLHKASMMAMKIVIKPFKTLRFNLAITKPFNADFDGDEMNIHVPQSLESQFELQQLSSVKQNIISYQASKPSIAIVQDSLLGSYLMTKSKNKLTKDQFFNIAMKLEDYKDAKSVLKKIQYIRRVLKNNNKKIQCFNAKGLLSLILKKDFCYEKNNKGSLEEPILKIKDGVLLEGVLNKAILGSNHNSLIQVIYKEYGSDEALKFIDGIHFITNNWLLINGFSVGLKDCIVSDKLNEEGVSKSQEIKDVIFKCFIEAEQIKKMTTNENIKELRINASLNKAKDIGLRIAKNALSSDNNFLSTVNSGSKGDFFNIAQITGLLGQQNLKGQRVKKLLNNGKRTLPHYPFEITDLETEYESRGFISSSFIKGLNPREFYFHAMSGREGISDTAMGTATSGYMQRRIVKLTEDIKIQYDGTVRDTFGKIYQLSYGENGFDPSKVVKVNKKLQVCNISRIVNKLNKKYE